MTEQEWVVKLGKSIPSEFLEIIKEYRNNIPIDIYGMCMECGIPIYAISMDTKVDGWIEYTEGDKFEIYINPKYHALRKCYTLAHELFYFLLHKDKIMQNGNLDRGYKASGGFNIIEWQANLFASELLVPTSKILDDILNMDFKDNPIESLSEKIRYKYQVSNNVAVRRARRALKLFF